MWLWHLLATLGVVAAVGLLTALVCFFKVFYSPARKKLGADEYEYPEGRIY